MSGEHSLRSRGSLSRPCPTAVARGLRGAPTFLRDWLAGRAGGNGRVFTARLGCQGRRLAVTYLDGRGRWALRELHRPLRVEAAVPTCRPTIATSAALCCRRRLISTSISPSI